MAKFVYRMQNILDLKIKMEEQRKAEYGLANARLRKEEDKLRELIIRKAGYEKQARELVQGTIDVHKIHTCKHAIDTQMIEVHVAEKNVELARSKLNQVMIERKTYEKLREKAFEEFKQEVAYEENRMVDELVSYNYHKES